MAHLSLQDHDGSSGASDQDTLAPLLHPAEAPWPTAFPYQYPPAHSHPDPAHSFCEAGGGSAGSQHSEGNIHCLAVSAACSNNLANHCRTLAHQSDSLLATNLTFTSSALFLHYRP